MKVGNEGERPTSTSFPLRSLTFTLSFHGPFRILSLHVLVGSEYALHAHRVMSMGCTRCGDETKSSVVDCLDFFLCDSAELLIGLKDG